MHFSVIGFKRPGTHADASIRYNNSEQVCYEVTAIVSHRVPEVIVFSTASSFIVLCGWHSRNQLEDAMVAVRKWGRIAEADFSAVFFHYGGLAAWETLRHALNATVDNSGFEALIAGFELSARFGLVGPTLSQVYEFACDRFDTAEAV